MLALPVIAPSGAVTLVTVLHALISMRLDNYSALHQAAFGDNWEAVADVKMQQADYDETTMPV